MKNLKKVTTVALTVALLTTAATLTSYAANLTGLNLSYTSNFSSDHTYEPKGHSYFQGFYQASSQAWNHNARAGTHYNTGADVKGIAYVTIYYVNKNGKIASVPKDTGNAKTGWIETPWAEIPNSGITPTKIEFKAIKYLKDGDTITDKVTVNK